MTIRDRLYFKFFLFNQRYGRIFCAFIEGLLLGFLLLVLILTLYGTASFVVWMYNSYTTSQKAIHEAQTEAKAYQNMLLACLNGGVIGRAGDEVIGCQGAVTFKFGRAK